MKTHRGRFLLCTMSMILASLLLTGCSVKNEQGDSVSPDQTAVQEGNMFDVLDEETCTQILIDEAKLSVSAAELQTTQLFSQQGSSNEEQELIRYICYEYAEEYPDHPVGFGFIAAVATGEKPAYKDICYVYSAVADDETAEFVPGAQSFVIINDTTVQINSDGQLTVSGQDFARHEVSCYRNVDLTEFYPIASQ